MLDAHNGLLTIWVSYNYGSLYGAHMDFCSYSSSLYGCLHGLYMVRKNNMAFVHMVLFGPVSYGDLLYGIPYGPYMDDHHMVNCDMVHYMVTIWMITIW